tara:strand:- start:110 stop:247 length:138 start_codon:yes stop_codon:yes gene_type:complete
MEKHNYNLASFLLRDQNTNIKHYATKNCRDKKGISEKNKNEILIL